MAQDITSANAALIISCPGVFQAQQIQGFASDDVYAVDPLEIGQTVMGVDGQLSAGFVFNPVSVKYSLQAGSPSVTLFDTLYQQSLQNEQVYWLQGSIRLFSTNNKYTLTNGVLTNYPPVPDAGKILKPRVFTVVWERITPAPTI